MGDVGGWARLGLALAVVASVAFLMIRRFDVRLVLLGAGLTLALAAGNPLAIPDAFGRAMVATMVGPICVAMGFAAVLHATGCDQQLVRLLLRPLRRAGWALLPGGVLTAYLVNLAVPSQTSTAAAVGPILVPLLLAAGVPAERAAAALLLGASFGGDLLNPGAQDIQSIAVVTGLSVRAIHSHIAFAGGAGVLVASVIAALNCPRSAAIPTPTASSEPPVNFFKAFIPLVPVTLLLLAYVGFPPLAWLVVIPEGPQWRPFAGALPVVRAVLIGTALALVAGWRDVQTLSRTFFADMGGAYGNIIALTITAQCFGAGLSALGVSTLLLDRTRGSAWALSLLAVLFPWGLAFLSGSGSGPVLTFAETFLKDLGRPEDVTLAALACLAGACGRTMSPVAAVVLYCAGLVGVEPFRLVRIVLPALLFGWLVALAIVLAGVQMH